MSAKTILSVFGTRPEAIRMCPLIKTLQTQAGIRSLVCLVAQGKPEARQVLEYFDIAADHTLDITEKGVTPADALARILLRMEGLLAQVRPDFVLVQGGTVVAFAAALAAFYARIPVGHVGAGVRFTMPDARYPEEVNRRLIARCTNLHFVATQHAADNLAREGVAADIHLTGSTAIDALRYTVQGNYIFDNSLLWQLDLANRIVLVTCHRRENWIRPLSNICDAVLALSKRHADVQFVFPMPENAIVNDMARAKLENQPRIMVTDALGMRDMHNLIARSCLIMTDSRGIVEEAPALNVPVLILRKETECPEALQTGAAMMTGLRSEDIQRMTSLLLDDSAAHGAMQKASCPYGDGHASERIAAQIVSFLAR